MIQLLSIAVSFAVACHFFTSHPSHKTAIVHECTAHERHAAWYFIIQYFLFICLGGDGNCLILESANIWG